MSNENLNKITDQQTITSMEIAEITGRAHKNVLQAIRNMEPAWENVQGLKFQLLYRDVKVGNNSIKKNPYYSLTKTECLFVATKFNDEARAKLVLRWEQLEKERLMQTNLQSEETNLHPTQFNEHNSSTDTLPVDPRNLSRLQILQLALAAEEESERLREEKQQLESNNYGLMLENSQKEQQIKQLEERTAYLRVIMADNSTVTASQIAQDYGMSAVAFNNLLRGIGIQRKIGEQWILYSPFLNHGYVATRMIPIHHAGGQDTFKPMTVWTQLGRKFLYDRLKKHGTLPVMERGQPQLSASQQSSHTS